MSRIRMSDLVTAERILPTLGAIDKRQVIEALSRLAAAQTGLPKNVILRAVQTSEGFDDVRNWPRHRYSSRRCRRDRKAVRSLRSLEKAG